MQQTKQNGHCQNLNVLLSNPLYMNILQSVCSSTDEYLGCLQDFVTTRGAVANLLSSENNLTFLIKLNVLNIEPTNFINELT